MPKIQYYQNMKHWRYFSLYWSLGPPPVELKLQGDICIVASKKGVHPNAVKRNFAKRRLRAALRNYLKTESLPKVTLKIVAKREILNCSFEDLNHMLHNTLKALS